MNKLTIALVAAVAFAFSAQAYYGRRGHDFFEKKQEERSAAMNKLTDKKTLEEANSLFKKVEKQHEKMVSMFEKIDEMKKEKHESMDKLDTLLGLSKTRKWRDKGRKMREQKVLVVKEEKPMVVKEKPVMIIDDTKVMVQPEQETPVIVQEEVMTVKTK